MKLDYLTKDSRFADNSSRVTHRADLISILQNRLVARNRNSLSIPMHSIKSIQDKLLNVLPTNFCTTLLRGWTCSKSRSCSINKREGRRRRKWKGNEDSPPPFPSVFFFFFPPVCLLIKSETWSKSTSREDTFAFFASRKFMPRSFLNSKNLWKFIPAKFPKAYSEILS